MQMFILDTNTTNVFLQENLTRGVNPLIQQWMASTTTAQLNSFVPSIRVTEEQIMHYVVKKDKTPSREAPMETSPLVQSPGASAVESPQVYLFSSML